MAEQNVLKKVRKIGTAFCNTKGWNYKCPHCNSWAFMQENSYKRKHSFCPLCGKPIEFDDKELHKAYKHQKEYRESLMY